MCGYVCKSKAEQRLMEFSSVWYPTRPVSGFIDAGTMDNKPISNGVRSARRHDNFQLTMQARYN